MIDSMPKYQAHISREGHNLEHSFEFTSSTGHLLTLFADILIPDDTISGNISMFSRTNPLAVPANVEIDQYIDYFFVPLDMLYSGFGDSLFLVNEPYSSMINVMPGNDLPVVKFDQGSTPILKYLFDATGSTVSKANPATKGYVDFSVLDYYKKDSMFFSFFRNMFHNYMNPNSLFYEEYKAMYDRPKATYSVIPADFFQPNILPLSLMAYNCCYENFYRLDDREVFYNAIYNIDSVVSSGEELFSDDNADFVFSLKYRPYFFDYFTSLKVSPLLNSNNLGATFPPAWNQIRNYMSSLGITNVASDGSVSGDLTDSTSIAQGIESSLVSTAQLRSMFAVEKIMSVTNRAKKTYDAQVLAHMGAKVPRDVRHELHYLGTQRSNWKIGEVISMAGTSDTPLGDMAGKGYASFDDKKIHFTAPCHGIFIGIYSSVPRMRYYAPLEKHMQISNRLDFWFEEYEKLGMQPAFFYEAFPVLEAYDGTSMTAKFGTLGWQMRYQQYKQRFDKVSPAFIDTVLCSPDGPTADNPQGEFELGNFNSWKNWVLSKRPFNIDKDFTVHASDFLASPTDLNDIMSVKYGWFLTKDPNSESIPDYWKFDWIGDELQEGFTWNVASLFYRDPFIHFAKLDFKKVSKMSSNTLPDLNF